MNKEISFGHYTSNIEQIPFSDSEAQDILRLDTEEFDRGIQSGLMKRSVPIHYRFDQAFSFIGLLDLFEYMLRKEFFFLVYKNSPEINELVGSLVDEIARVIDYQTFGGEETLTVDMVLVSLKHLCNASHETWKKYWLLNGEAFSVEKCAIITLKSWCSLFERSMTEIGIDETVKLQPNSQFGLSIPA